MELKTKIWLEHGGRLVFGPGRAQLLRTVEERGSISAAASALEMSYRHAWSMIRASEQRLGRSLVQTRRGGSGGGGARLTDYARELLRRFEETKKEFDDLTEETMEDIRDLAR